MHFVMPPDASSTLSLAMSRTECSADLRPIANTVLGQLGAAAAAYAAGTTLPAVTGVSITTHGDPKGAWYFSLGPNIPRELFPRPPNAGGAGGPQRAPRPPGEAGLGAGPPAFQPQITVAPNANAAPRAAFTPSPALLAAVVPFRALVSCVYASVLTPDDAKARGFDIVPPGLPGAPRPSPAPTLSPAPGASPAPRRNPPGAGFVNYAPSPGFFVVRVPDLGTGGGSVKQP
jgi:hypothetical protein